MAIDLNGKTLAELEALATTTLDKAESAEEVSEKKTYDDDLNAIIAKFNEDSKTACYMACRDSAQPLVAAIIAYYYSGLKIKETRDKEANTVIREVVKVRRPLDISNFWKWMKDRKNECGADYLWYYYAEKLNILLAVRAAERMGNGKLEKLFKDNWDKCANLSEVARQIESGKTPTSNTNLTRVLQKVINAMLGEREETKVITKDLNLVCDTYAKLNQKEELGVSLPNHNTFRRALKVVCYRMLTGEDGFGVASKEFDMDRALEIAEAAASGKSTNPKRSKKAPKDEPKQEIPVDEEASDESEDTEESTAA